MICTDRAVLHIIPGVFQRLVIYIEIPNRRVIVCVGNGNIARNQTNFGCIVKQVSLVQRVCCGIVIIFIPVTVAETNKLRPNIAHCAFVKARIIEQPSGVCSSLIA